MTSTTERRVTSPSSFFISPSITSTAGSSTRATHGRRSRRDRLAEDGERLVGCHGAIDVERSAHHGAGAPTEQYANRPAEDADQHPDQRAACGADELGVVGALRGLELTVRRALDDRGGVQSDPAVGVGVLQHAQSLVRLARLREPNDDHVLFCQHLVLLSLEHL
jgi:hypothetical protein